MKKIIFVSILFTTLTVICVRLLFINFNLTSKYEKLDIDNYQLREDLKNKDKELSDKAQELNKLDMDNYQLQEDLKNKDKELSDKAQELNTLNNDYNNLKASYTSLENINKNYKNKADFVDNHVLIANSGKYHRFSCVNCPKYSFNIYRYEYRAEADGYKKCSKCLN